VTRLERLAADAAITPRELRSYLFLKIARPHHRHPCPSKQTQRFWPIY
jgi:hypothetical protein